MLRVARRQPDDVVGPRDREAGVGRAQPRFGVGDERCAVAVEELDVVGERLDRESVSYTNANKEAIFLDAGVYSFVDAVSVIAVAITLAAAGQLGVAGVAVDGTLSVGVLVAFIDALGRFFLPVRELSNKTTIIQSALVAADRIAELEQEPETIAAPSSPVPARFERELRLRDVEFAYGDGPPVLLPVPARGPVPVLLPRLRGPVHPR